MGDFKKFGNKKFDNSRDRKPSRGGFGGGFGGGSKFGGRRDDGPRQMHSATCAKCGNACEVPFKPVGGKPVLCSNCFKGKEDFAPRFGGSSFGGERRGGFSGGRDRDRGSFTPKAPAVTKEMFDSLNAKVDKILSILSVPQKTTHNDLDVGDVVKPKKAEKVTVKKTTAPAKKVVEKKVKKEKKAKKK